MAGEQGQRGLVGLIDDPNVRRLNDERLADRVHEVAILVRQEDLVTRLEFVEVSERLLLADAMTTKDDVAHLTGHRRSRPPTDTFVQRRQGDTSIDGLQKFDSRNVDGSDDHLGLDGVLIG